MKGYAKIVLSKEDKDKIKRAHDNINKDSLENFKRLIEECYQKHWWKDKLVDVEKHYIVCKEYPLLTYHTDFGIIYCYRLFLGDCIEKVSNLSESSDTLYLDVDLCKALEYIKENY